MKSTSDRSISSDVTFAVVRSEPSPQSTVTTCVSPVPRSMNRVPSSCTAMPSAFRGWSSPASITGSTFVTSTRVEVSSLPPSIASATVTVMSYVPLSGN